MSFLHSFGVNAEQRLKRTRFKHHDTRDLTFAPGWLVPVYARDVIPSDVWNAKEINVQVKQVLESLKPTFGDVYLSMYYFFVPYRLLWKKWPEIFGKGTPSEWDSPVETVAPRCKYHAGVNYGVNTKSKTGDGYSALVNTCCVTGNTNPPVIVSEKYNLADYLGFALTALSQDSITAHDINWMWFAAYEKIWTDFFRNENVQEPDPDVEKCFNYSGSGALDVRFGLHFANKLKDVYTTILPSPQKGAPVTVSLGDVAPVMVGTDSAIIEKNTNLGLYVSEDVGTGEGLVKSSAAKVVHDDVVDGYGHLFADLSNAVGATVNEVRFDFAMQRMKERDARGGTRYNEVLLSTFEAYNGDVTLARPELLGGDTIQLNMTTVPSTGSNPGKLGGMSNTNASTRPFVKTFGEFGVLMGVACVRPRNMYAQGMPKAAMKYRRYHWYDPALQNVGDQPVGKPELYALAASDSVLGFQEAWYEYRSDENIVCADMRGGTSDMDAWSYVLEFSGEPYLNSDFMVQDGKAITKTLVGYNTDYPGYVYAMHIDFHMEVTSPMMPHSIPGLIDHIM